MKTIRIPQLKSTDLDLDFTDDELEYMVEILERDFPEVKYEIIERPDDEFQAKANTR